MRNHGTTSLYSVTCSQVISDSINLYCIVLQSDVVSFFPIPPFPFSRFPSFQFPSEDHDVVMTTKFYMRKYDII